MFADIHTHTDTRVYVHVPLLWWHTGSKSRSMNIASSSGWQPARKRSTMEERDAVAALPWNLLPTFVRIRPYRILRNDEPTDPVNNIQFIQTLI